MGQYSNATGSNFELEKLLVETVEGVQGDTGAKGDTGVAA